MVLMKFVKGRTIEELEASPQGAKEFLEFIQDEKFQVELGRILGADVFSGNADRMHVFVPNVKFFGSGEGKNEVFANPGNLIIKKKPRGSVRPIAIDNRFGFRDPETHLIPNRKALIEKNFGLWGLGCGAVPSLALAVGQLAHQEAGLLFEHFLSLARKAGVQQEKIDQVGRESKQKFQENVANGANQALNSLLNGQNWKAMLRHYECEKKEIDAFRQHKRLLRQLMATTEPEMVTTTMIETAIDNTNFKQWVQTHKYKLEDKAFVENVLQEPLNYKLA